MLNTGSAGTLTYPSAEDWGFDDRLEDYDPSNDEIDESLSRNVDTWNVRSSDFEFNGSITAEVKLGDNEVSVGDVLAAFDGDECRGVAHAISNPFGDHLVFPLMVYGNDENSSISFKYYDSLSGEVINMAETILFESDMALGNAIETVVLNSESSVSGLVSQFELKAAYPNPFNPNTTISYALPQESYVNISIYDLQGYLVIELVNDMESEGYHTINWDGSELSSGVYLINMQSGGFNTTQKVVLMK
jgi:hypothetical protein